MGAGCREPAEREKEWARELPSFKLFCTEAFQFDYEAPFHRAWMLYAIQNESEPLVSTGAVGMTGATPARHALSPHCLVMLQGKRVERWSLGSWLSGWERGIDALRLLECDVRFPTAKSVKDSFVSQRKKACMLIFWKRPRCASTDLKKKIFLPCSRYV